MKETGGFELIDKEGHRKYLNKVERLLFKHAIESANSPESLFCLMLYWTGARISEILDLTTPRIDLVRELVVIRCLKKRNREPVWRRIPLPAEFINQLDRYYGLSVSRNPQRLWTWSRSTASRRVDTIMKIAGIKGKHANPRGCRHSFGLFCAQKGIPASVLKKWMGHENIATTMIYMDFTIEDQREFAKRLWD